MKKWAKILLIILLIIIIMIIAVCWYGKNKLNKINYMDISKEDIEINEKVEEKLTGYRNIAIFGIDTRDNTYEDSRSDCIVIASINHDKKEIKLVSVYRDTYLKITGRSLDKVNHAYWYGGPEI